MTEFVTKTGAQPADEVLGFTGADVVSETDYLPVFKAPVAELAKGNPKLDVDAYKTAIHDLGSPRNREKAAIVKSIYKSFEENHRGLVDQAMPGDSVIGARRVDKIIGNTPPEPVKIDKSADPGRYDNPVLQRLYEQARHEGSRGEFTYHADPNPYRRA